MTNVAVILFNLGGPDRSESVRPFLYNLFNDPAILPLPWLFRSLLAWQIARKRAPSARATYAKIGGASPLLANSQAQMQALQRQLGGDYRLRLAMRYWHPRAQEALDHLRRDRPDKIVLLPLYPHYSKTTTGSSFAEWHRLARKAGLTIPTKEISAYPLLPGFLSAQARAAKLRIDAARNQSGRTPYVIFSAHGLPQRVVDQGDPYQQQMEQSAEALAGMLSLPKDRWVLAYQSKVGPLKWLEPATDRVIAERARAGEALVVLPLAFVSDHVETLVELDMDYRDLAEQEGAAGFWRVPAIGTDPDFIKGLATLVREAAATD